jgi:CBS domain-containing protein
VDDGESRHGSGGDADRKSRQLMVTRGFRHLPIVDGERTIGIVSLRDVVRSVVRVYPEYEDETE